LRNKALGVISNIKEGEAIPPELEKSLQHAKEVLKNIDKQGEELNSIMQKISKEK